MADQGGAKGQSPPQQNVSGGGKRKNRKKNKGGNSPRQQGTATSEQQTLASAEVQSEEVKVSAQQPQDKQPQDGKAETKPQTSCDAQSKGQGHQQGQPQEAPSDGAPQKSKAQLRAERRALQEAQRALKSNKKGDGAGGGKQQEQTPKRPDSQGSGSKDTFRVPDNMQMDNEKTRKRMSKKLEKQKVPERPDSNRKVGLFSHLHQYDRDLSLTHKVRFASTCSIHPAILKLGLQYAEGVICGSNARCIALLAAMKKVIADYVTPPQKELARDLDAKIKPYISFLTQCRPLSVSMGNAIKYLKWQITHMQGDMSDIKAKKQLQDSIDNFVNENIKLAGEAISGYVGSKINDGDVILVYGYSSLIEKVLHDARKKGTNFRVIVVDGRPKLEGQEMLRRLVERDIKCTYVLINAASYVMSEVTKVFLGAHALLANGCVMSRVGCSQVALVAKSYNVPVLVCCETYKFCERVQTDSFVFNELGDPNDLVNTGSLNGSLSSWKDVTSLSLLNLAYDVTPPELISLVITEIGMVPCTSVPVVLRVKHAVEKEI